MGKGGQDNFGLAVSECDMKAVSHVPPAEPTRTGCFDGEEAAAVAGLCSLFDVGDGPGRRGAIDYANGG